MRLLAFAALLTCSASVSFAQTGWRLATQDTGWLPRTGQRMVAFNGKIWAYNGGQANPFGDAEDAWSSSDGVAWIKEVDQLPWLDRGGQTFVVHNNLLWMLGGWSGLPFENDVWSSPDGETWTQVQPNAPWTGRAHHCTVVFNGKMWVLGGEGILSRFTTNLNDVWSSPDGVNWTQEVAAAAWPARSGHAALVFNNRMWVIGGGVDAMGDPRRDIWSSDDGVNWILEVAQAPWPARLIDGAEVFNGRMWISGGENLWGVDYMDVWSSADGVTWVQETAAAPWGIRDGHASVVFKNRLWLSGGVSTTERFSDVWSYGLHIKSWTLPAGLLNVPYSEALETREGTGPYTWTHTGGALPPGLTLVSSTGDSVAVTGTPTALGTYTFTVKVTDSTGNYDEQVISLTITKINQAGANSSPGCALAPGNFPAAPLAAGATMALFALARRRRCW